ncbi:MAG: hypothetical protein DCC60_09580 [Ignavibacteriae bacterium]|nr:MAG: hypothetical protein DCC60_09580 [Ignavibacteriota bacterium]
MGGVEVTIYLIANLRGSLVEVTQKTGVVQKKLQDLGHEVVNPLGLTKTATEATPIEVEKQAIDKCDAVFVMDNRTELIKYAYYRDKEIISNIKEVEAGK